MSFVGEKYKHDIFVSYSHGTPAHGENETDLKRWTHAFVRKLEEDIRNSVQGPDRNVEIWYDEHLKGNKYLTNQLKTEIAQAAVLVIIMTNEYLDSDWCTTEVQWFEAELTRRGHDVESIFVIRAMPTDSSRWPTFLKDERQETVTGFPFCDESARRAARPFGWPSPADQEGRFYEALSKVSSALAERLEALRADSETKAAPKPVSPGPGLGEPKVVFDPAKGVVQGPVFLALGTPDVTPACSNLRDELTKAGIEVLPGLDLTLEMLSAELLNANLGSSLAFVQLLGILPGPDDGGMERVQQQYQRAIDMHLPTVLWRDNRIPTETIAYESYRNFVANLIPQLKADLGDVVTAVREALAHREGAALVTAYLQAHAAAQDQFNRVKRALEEEDCIVLPLKPPAPGAPMAEIQAESKQRRSLFAVPWLSPALQ
jgi:hypothetical protein